MKMMHGACALPCSNRSRTRLAPTPTNISTKSEPDIEKNGRPASPATARASSVLPVPGGPTSRQPFGRRPPSFVNFCGSFRNSMISCELLLRLVGAGDVGERHLGRVAGEQLRLRLAERERLRAARLHLPEEEQVEADQQQPRQEAHDHAQQVRLRRPSAVIGTPRAVQLVHLGLRVRYRAAAR